MSQLDHLPLKKRSDSFPDTCSSWSKLENACFNGMHCWGSLWHLIKRVPFHSHLLDTNVCTHTCVYTHTLSWEGCVHCCQTSCLPELAVLSNSGSTYSCSYQACCVAKLCVKLQNRPSRVVNRKYILLIFSKAKKLQDFGHRLVSIRNDAANWFHLLVV